MTQVTLEAGKDYGFCFGISMDMKKAGMEMIYNGEISWTAKRPGAEQTADSQKTTDGAIEYINRANVNMGKF